MSRKHFIALAEALERQADKIPPDVLCQQQNRTACGVDAWQRPQRKEVA